MQRTIAHTPACSGRLAGHSRPVARAMSAAGCSSSPAARVHAIRGSSFLDASGCAALSAARPVARQVAAKGQMRVAAEISYIMCKPDAVQRGHVGEIISRFEKKGFKLRGLKLFQTPESLAKEHYKDLSERPFYNDLVSYIVSGPVVCMVWEGAGVVKAARKMIGATNPLEAEPGTIRGDLAVQTGRNIVHGSDSTENGERETALWFKEDEIVDWSPSMAPWLYE